MNRTQTIPERIADELSGRILDGEFAPGARLPSLRALSAEYEVNVSTIQRVLVVLQERGLAISRDRAGIEVQDPNVTGGTALWPLLLASNGTADRSTALLSDALAARRLLAVSVVRQLSEQPPSTYVPALEAAVTAFAAVAEQMPTDLRALSRAETAIIRALLLATARPAVLAIFNDITQMLATSSGALAAIYSNLAMTISAWKAFVEQARDGDIRPYARLAESVLESMDANIVAAFRANHASQATREMA
jgi:DNA-binding FadR family transcriptional regulator